MRTGLFSETLKENSFKWSLLFLAAVLLLLAWQMFAGAETAAAFDTTLPVGPECINCHLSGKVMRGENPPAVLVTCGDGDCHQTRLDTQQSGSHQTHFDYNLNGNNPVSTKGPQIQTCSVCHGHNGDGGGHMNGVVNFNDGKTLSNTAVCSGCHSPGGAFNGVNSSGQSVGAKNNWASGVYDDAATLNSSKAKWCVGCHDNQPSKIPGYDATAPTVGGDNSGYGFFINGHGFTGTYDGNQVGQGGGNPGASRSCPDCHKLNTTHIDGVNGTGVADQRLIDTTATTVMGFCKTCHGPNVSGATKKVSTHGNYGPSFTAQKEALFSVQCQQCHEPHGNNLNASTTPSRNLKMIRNKARITETTLSGDVFFTSKTNADSFDDGNGKGICRVCHQSSDNPGNPMSGWIGGEGGGGMPPSLEDDCTSCHKHDYAADGTVDYDDGFMQNIGAACEGACHKTLTSSQKNGSHETHFAYNDTLDPESYKGPGIVLCDVCHGIGASQGNPDFMNNGTKNFLDGATVNLTDTVACDNCHSKLGAYNGVKSTTDSIGAKNSWNASGSLPYSDFGVYPGDALVDTNTALKGVYETTVSFWPGKQKWCVGCHDDYPSSIEPTTAVGPQPDGWGTTLTAPGVGGNRTSYGFYVAGHGLATNTAYDGDSLNNTSTGNPGAGKECDDCHNLSMTHLIAGDDTNTTGQRLKSNIAGNPTNNTVTGVCKACHGQNGGASKKVSQHGNATDTGYNQIESDTAPFAIECAQCHEPHANNLNSAVPATRNLRMIRGNLRVSIESTLTTPVVFKSTTGTNSFDDNTGKGICVACHQSPPNPGQMTRHTGGVHTDTVLSRAGLGDKTGQKCTWCHRHDYKDDATVTAGEGFMPSPFPTTYTTSPKIAFGTCSSGQYCHGSYTSAPFRQETGSHLTHFDSTRGPGITTCDTCHGFNAGSGTQVGHFNGVVNFKDVADETLGVTGACDNCHSQNGAFNGVSDTTWQVGAKSNWPTKIYDDGGAVKLGKEKWCVGCHDDQPSRITGFDATAPMVGGDNNRYGFFKSGHGVATSTAYDGDSLDNTSTGNSGAGRKCWDCHDLTKKHLDGQDGTDLVKQRLFDTTATTVMGFCKTCHGQTGSAIKVSSHGNATETSYTPIEGPFTVQCQQCHEPHGRNLNSATPQTRNIRMIRSDVRTMDNTARPVVFTNTSETDSFDEDDDPATQNNDDICATCHVYTNQMRYRVGGESNSTGTMGEQRGKDCTGCHNHDYKGDQDVAYDEGFMPTGCDGCHGYPPKVAGVDDTGTRGYPGIIGAHVKHNEEYGFGCEVCHGHDGDTAQMANYVSRVVLVDNATFNFQDTSFPGGTRLFNGGQTPTITTSTATTQTATCQVGCHNPIIFYAGSETPSMTNVATWTVTNIACARCHDTQATAFNGGSINNTTYTSAHKINTDSRADCLICHVVVPGTASDTHEKGTIKVKPYGSTTGTTDVLIFGRVVNGQIVATDTAIAKQFCLSCHDTDSSQTAPWSTYPTLKPPNIKQYWDTSPAHDTTGGASNTGYGCFGSGQYGGSGCHSTPHGSAKRKMLAPANIAGSDEEAFCLNCHQASNMAGAPGAIKAAIDAYNEGKASFGTGMSVSGIGTNWTTAMNGWYIKNSADGPNAWTQISTVNSTVSITLTGNYKGSPLTNISYKAQANISTHPLVDKTGSHSTTEGTSANWNPDTNRHVECEDCHNPHSAEKGNHTKGQQAVGEVQKGVWGVTPSYGSAYTSGTAKFMNGQTGVAGTGTSWSGNVQAGWYIKSNFDRSGRWYKIQTVSNNTSITLTTAYDGRFTADAVDAGAGQAVDYVAQAAPTYTRVAEAANQYQICLKCHSSYSYDSTSPDVPSGMTSTTIDAFQQAKQSDLALDFSPNHVAYHPLVARGKNQPINPTGLTSSYSAWNANWKKFTLNNVRISASGNATFTVGTNLPSTVIEGWFLRKGTATPNSSTQTGWYQVTKVNSLTSPASLDVTPAPGSIQAESSYTLTAGLGDTFVWPMGPWAYVVCSDCHGSDNNAAEGPHGSSKRWNLKIMNPTVSFPWMGTDNGAVTTVSISRGNAVESPLCLNCHRPDVYGDIGNTSPGNAALSRVTHPPDAGQGRMYGTGSTKWRVLCMTCHGGDSLGGIHGTSAKRGYTYVSQTSISGIGTSGNNERGRRFLNGATWTGVTRATASVGVACWTKQAADEVGTCGRSHTGGDLGPTAAYDYENGL